MRNLSALDDTEVIREAQKGSATAFDELVYRYDKQVLSIAARYVNQADDAKDIYQEVFLRVYRGLNKFQERSEFSTWLYRITTNVCLTHGTRRKEHARRNRSIHPDGDAEDHSQQEIGTSDLTADTHTMNSEISSRVHQAMTALSSQQRLVFTLKHYEGYKLREIADMIDCSEGTVKKYLFDATRRMRTQLKDLYG